MIKFNQITWYSKLLSAIFIFGIFPLLMFMAGMEYQKVLEINESIKTVDTPVGQNPQTIDEPKSSQPTTTTNAKLNIRAVCENALSYMSFVDGDAAEKFVDECVEGMHPEVIERYLLDMGVDGKVI